MNYFKIKIVGDHGTQARISILGGYQIPESENEYILDTKQTEHRIKEDLLQTAEAVEITPLTLHEFEKISRERVGFFALHPEFGQ